MGPIERKTPFLLHGYEVATGVADKPVKTVLPGPVTFARFSRDRHYADREALARIMQTLAARSADILADGRDWREFLD